MLPGVISSALPLIVEEHLGAGDDRKLWEELLRVVAEDASALLVGSRNSPLYANIGACSHWLRPHQSRWTAAGGFALPVGYGDGEGFLRGLPNLDWRVILQLDQTEHGWINPQQPPTKGFDSVRIAVPTRTARHRKAAVHAIWSRGTLNPKHKQTVFYGFRKLDESWKFAARYSNGEGAGDTP